MGAKGPRPATGRRAEQTATTSAPGLSERFPSWASERCGISPDRVVDPTRPSSTGENALSGEISASVFDFFDQAELGVDRFAETVALAALDGSTAEQLAIGAARNLLDASAAGAAAALLGGLPGIALAAAVKTGLDAAWSHFVPPRSTQAAMEITLFANDFKAALLSSRRAFVTAATTCMTLGSGDQAEELMAMMDLDRSLRAAIKRVDPRLATAAALAGAWHRVKQNVKKEESFFPALVEAPRVEVLAYWDPANDRVVVRDMQVPGADPATVGLVRDARVGDSQLPRRVTLGNVDLTWDARDGTVTSVKSSRHADGWLGDLARRQRGARWESSDDAAREGLVALDHRVAMANLS